MLTGAVVIITSAFSHCIAQDDEYDSLLQYYLEEDMRLLDEIENDTTLFFALLDSVLNLEVPSLLSVYTNYSSKVLYSGRDYGIDQYGLMMGVSYFHKSGMYIDVSGSYYNKITPGYNATNLSLGYAGSITKKLNYMASYEHYFYNTIDEVNSIDYSLNNSVRVFTSLRTSLLTAGVEGAMYFGNGSQSYRLTPQLRFHPKIKSKGLLSKFTLQPTVLFQITDENIYTTGFRYYTARRIIDRIGRDRFIRLYNRQDSQLYDLLNTENIESVFTLSNVAIALPLRYNIKKWSATATYNLNFPIALPGEVLDDTTTDYFSLSVSYSLGL